MYVQNSFNIEQSSSISWAWLAHSFNILRSLFSSAKNLLIKNNIKNIKKNKKKYLSCEPRPTIAILKIFVPFWPGIFACTLGSPINAQGFFKAHSSTQQLLAILNRCKIIDTLKFWLHDRFFIVTRKQRKMQLNYMAASHLFLYKR